MTNKYATTLLLLSLLSPFSNATSIAGQSLETLEAGKQAETFSGNSLAVLNQYGVSFYRYFADGTFKSYSTIGTVKSYSTIGTVLHSGIWSEQDSSICATVTRVENRKNPILSNPKEYCMVFDIDKNGKDWLSTNQAGHEIRYILFDGHPDIREAIRTIRPR